MLAIARKSSSFGGGIFADQKGGCRSTWRWSLHMVKSDMIVVVGLFDTLRKPSDIGCGGTMPPIPNFGEMLMRGHDATYTELR
jgi:hypothetical protein